jgi:predicted AAA+ superfamily ATPase
MQEISSDEIIQRIRLENPWWEGLHTIAPVYKDFKPRAYFRLFFPLTKKTDVRRAVVLMGPRRVGKTVMIHHAIQGLLNEGVSSGALCYFSVDHPIYNGLSLEKLLDYYTQATGVNYKTEEIYVFFDEIQYLRKWEVHLKSVVDTYPNIKALASGSAAAALRLKSEESGAGRFTDFLLPPLTFYEYLDLLGKTDMVEVPSVREPGAAFFVARNIDELNEQFIQYLNFGGYPEVMFSTRIQDDPARFIKSDIIDKVLLRDLPSLYGISDIQELNYLFTALAFNTGKEVSLEELSKNSGVAKNTIKRYIEYLEAAFLIKLVHRIDRNAKRFRRANFFKVYLANPSMRAALFSPLKANDEAMGALTETAIFSQWFHHEFGVMGLYYARWNDGEVDLVAVAPTTQKASWAVEVKWSDRFCENPGELKNVIGFCRSNALDSVQVTSRTKTVSCQVSGVKIHFVPASIYCYTVGFNIIHFKERQQDGAEGKRA